jgi:CRP/FNR family transcriptional regulator, transcriptional activator FtrB
MPSELAFFFSHLSEGSRRLLSGAHTQAYPDGVALFEQSQACVHVFGLIDGRVAKVRDVGDRSAILELCDAGSLLGVEALLLQDQHGFSARTVGKTRVLVIPAEALREPFATDLAVTRVLGAQLASEQVAAMRQISDLKVRTATERLAGWLAQSYEGVEPGRLNKLPLSKRMLSSLLGTTPNYLSKSFAALEAAGVQLRGKYVIISDPAALKRLQAI